MAFAPQNFEECTLMAAPELESYRNCCDSICFYPTVPVAQGTEYEVPLYSTVVYTLYPAVDIKEQDFYPVPQQSNQSILTDNACEGNRDKVAIFVTSSPDIEAKEKYVENSSQNLDESLTLSDCTPPEESEDQSGTSLPSPVFGNSFDLGFENTKLSNDSGYYDCNGCWYPSKNSSPESRKSLITENGSESMGSPTSDGKSSGIIPPTKLMMPKQLMSYYNYYQRLDLPSAALGRPHLVHTFPGDGNICVEDLWLAHMNLLFRNFPHKWDLRVAHAANHFDKSWSSFKDMAKVRFYCQNCLDGWTSMFGVVVFFYSFNSEMSCGTIRYQVSGQKCGKCNPDTFEMPLWYPEEAQKVITNLYYEIASRFYGLRTPQHIRTRRLGQPINQHNKSLCQGCTHGLCKPDGKFQGSEESEESFLPSVYGSSFPSSQNNSYGSSVPTFQQETVPCCAPYSYQSHFPVASTYLSPVNQQQISTGPTYFDPSVYQCSPMEVDMPYPNYAPHAQNYVPQMAVYYPFNY